VDEAKNELPIQDSPDVTGSRQQIESRAPEVVDGKDATPVVNAAPKNSTTVSKLVDLIYAAFAFVVLYLLVPFGEFFDLGKLKKGAMSLDTSEQNEAFLRNAVPKVIFAVIVLAVGFQLRQLALDYRASKPTVVVISTPEVPSDAYAIFQSFKGRMKVELSRLNRISIRNLSIGIIFSVFALFFIAYPLLVSPTVQQLSGQTQPQNVSAMDALVRYYLPRLGVGLLLQFVGFFFLRLYVANEQDIKHYASEVTNLESKMMAILVAEQRNDKALFKPIVENLAKTERNFTLKRNERTIHDEDRKYNDLKDVLNVFGKGLVNLANKDVGLSNGGRKKAES
jgi:hypothetical protein